MNRFKILRDEKPQPKVFKPPAPDTFSKDFKDERLELNSKFIKHIMDYIQKEEPGE